MAAQEVSPFTPGQPVPLDLFVGREEQVEKLAEKARAASRGRFQVAFLLGERGIGKTSLASFSCVLAERRHELASVHTLLGGVATPDEMVESVFDRMIKEAADTNWFDDIRGLVEDHIETIGLFGVEVGFSPSEEQLQELTSHFDVALDRVLGAISDETNGLVLVLDDINGLADSEDFANWLKSLVDTIATSDTDFPLVLLAVGTEKVRRNLIEHQPSLARVFDLITIDSWSDEELREFYMSAFQKVDISVEEGALGLMCDFAGGLPVLAHEIGDAAFRIDDDDHIDGRDAFRAVVTAADIVGHKHLQPRVLDSIRSERYRTILRKLPTSDLGKEFKREHALDYLEEDEERVFDNFLRKMRDYNVLEQHRERGQGWYRFTSELHYLYFVIEAFREERGED